MNRQSSHSRYKYRRVPDARKQPIRGLWELNDKFVARIGKVYGHLSNEHTQAQVARLNFGAAIATLAQANSIRPQTTWISGVQKVSELTATRSKRRMVKSQSASPSTAQPLGVSPKSACDILRNDIGRNSDLDRLPMLTWIMFLKFLDDLEVLREDEDKLAGKKFNPAIEPPYRWRKDGFSFTLPDMLKLLPIPHHGNVNEIIGKFGGADQLRTAVHPLQSLLYALQGDVLG